MEPLNRYIDHAILRSDASERDITRACDETLKHEFFGLAVNPIWNRIVADQLKGSRSVLVAVAGFPLGATTTRQKISEAVDGADSGAGEVDMVANIGWLKSGNYTAVQNEIRQIRRALPDTVPLKVIIEAPLLELRQIPLAVDAVIDGGAQFVKTATGFFGGTTEEILRETIRANAGRIKVKASGGIRDLETAELFLQLGADRLGSSASVAILAALRERARV